MFGESQRANSLGFVEGDFFTFVDMGFTIETHHVGDFCCCLFHFFYVHLYLGKIPIGFETTNWIYHRWIRNGNTCSKHLKVGVSLPVIRHVSPGPGPSCWSSTWWLWNSCNSWRSFNQNWVKLIGLDDNQKSWKLTSWGKGSWNLPLLAFLFIEII